uniref:Uncharacterized protein n=1 Tax=Oryza sativa subsp. japonica TaxID=39947 RepID=Q6Z1B2_ORYSJ|nr:hypothetical protein [Oryza sativa Japonica Group]
MCGDVGGINDIKLLRPDSVLQLASRGGKESTGAMVETKREHDGDRQTTVHKNKTAFPVNRCMNHQHCGGGGTSLKVQPTAVSPSLTMAPPNAVPH